MIQELQSKFKSMTEFSPEYVEKFICNLGLSDQINFLPEQYKQYFKDSGYRLYCSPSVLAHILIRLRPFINVSNFNFYTNIEPIEYDIYFNQLFEAFFSNSSIKDVECVITDEISQCDIAYVSENVPISSIKSIIQNTKNVIIIENLYDFNKLDHLQLYKNDCIISYYVEENTDNPKSSVAILFKSLAMFE